jgi:ribosomal protein L40E
VWSIYSTGKCSLSTIAQANRSDSAKPAGDKGLALNCSSCGFLNDTAAEFCENCGTALPRICDRCGNLLNPTARFCNKCGMLVTSPSAMHNPVQTTIDRLAALRQAAPSVLQDKMRAAAQSECI